MRKKSSIGQILLRKQFLSEEDLQQCLAQSRFFGKRLGQTAVDLGYISEEQLAEALSEHTGLPVTHLKELILPVDVLKLLPHKYCQKHRLIPFHKEGDTLFVAMHDPLDIQALDDIILMLKVKVAPSLCTASDLNYALDLQAGKTSPQDVSVQSLAEDIHVDMSQDLSVGQDIEQLANDAPIIKLVNLIIDKAIEKGASDIHIERYETGIVIRYRVDGLLYDTDAPPEKMFKIIISRIKLMAGMNIAEHRLPQDGRISYKWNQRDIDLRVSTLPSIHGEGVVLRILDKSQKLLDIEQLGLSGRNLELFKQAIEKPNGIILLTGPTGSGKTTALYAALSYIQSPEKKIITVEDPVEYQLNRINQLNVNTQIGFTFASGLRHILRQDPDIIMVGEIRDHETAEVAMRAALTGHLVLSTLHTNNSIGAITRLTNMNIEPYLVASTLSAVVAQRLVRTICEKCKTEKVVSHEDLATIPGLKEALGNQRHIYQGLGCDHCMRSGYKGRTGMYEVLVLDDDLKELIIQQKSQRSLRQMALKKGLTLLRHDGFSKVKQGLTTIEEVLRVTQDEESLA